MIPDDQPLPAVQEAEDPLRVAGLGAIREVAQMPDVVVGRDDRVPAVDHLVIHPLDREERAVAQLDDAAVPEVRIGREPRRHAPPP
jgi:hypothetical protein